MLAIDHPNMSTSEAPTVRFAVFTGNTSSHRFVVYSACYFYLLTKQLCQSDSELEYGISCVLQMFRTYSARTGVCESFPRNVNKHKPPVMEG